MSGPEVALNKYCLQGWINKWMGERKGIYLKLLYSRNISNPFQMEIGDTYTYMHILSDRYHPLKNGSQLIAMAPDFIVLKLELRVNKEHSGWSLKLPREDKVDFNRGIER